MRMLDLSPVEAAPASFGSDEVLSGVTLTREQPRTFGGQVLAQSIIAADRTVEGKALHSIHAYFLRPGDIERELFFSTQRLNDSRSFSTRRVQVFQDEAPMFSAIMSFQAESRGPEHTAVTMPDVPDPESLPMVSDYLGQLPHPIAQAVAWERPIDMRHVDAPLYTQPDSSSTEPRACVWFKTFDRLVHADGSEASDAEHRAAIAYASDYLPLEPALRRHGKFWLEPGLKSASLDHAMWFHRPARADEWLPVVVGAPSEFATNVLTLIVPKGNPAKVTGLNASLDKAKLVICAPAVPCGAATLKLSKATGITLKPVSEEQKVTDVRTKVETGEADAGLVYTTDAKASGDKVETIKIDSHGVVNHYLIAPTKSAANNKDAKIFIDYVNSKDGQAILAKAGFGPAASK